VDSIALQPIHTQTRETLEVAIESSIDPCSIAMVAKGHP
jgi:hypothetical protein